MEIIVVLSGTEFIFLTEAHIGFGFLMKIVVMTHRCFSCWRAVLTQDQGLFSFLCCLDREEAGGTQETGKGHSQDSCTGWPTPYGVVLSSKSRAKGGGGGTYSEWWHLSSQETITRDEPCFLGSGWMPACLWDVVNDSFFLCVLLVCMAFAVLTELSLSQPMSSCTFTSLILSPIPPRDTEPLTTWHWAACQGSATTEINKPQYASYH